MRRHETFRLPPAPNLKLPGPLDNQYATLCRSKLATSPTPFCWNFHCTTQKTSNTSFSLIATTIILLLDAHIDVGKNGKGNILTLPHEHNTTKTYRVLRQLFLIAWFILILISKLCHDSIGEEDLSIRHGLIYEFRTDLDTWIILTQALILSQGSSKKAQADFKDCKISQVKVMYRLLILVLIAKHISKHVI